MSAFRWCYIGSGSIARSTALNIERGSHVISAVYSRNFDRAWEFARKHHSTAYQTAEEAIKNCDAVYIATPHTAHLEYALKAMEMGKPVLCEKPVAVCEKDVDALIAAAKENDVYFCEAMWTWFSPVARKVREWVKSGELGEIKSVTMNYAFPGLLQPRTSRVRDPKTAGGALLDVGIYPITYCYNLFGYPDKIECEGRIEDGIDTEETVTLTYGEMKCVLNMSLKHLKEDCIIEGTNGKISLPFFHVAPVAKMRTLRSKAKYKGKTDYLTEFNCVAKEIREGKKESDYIPFESTKMCMRIMDECRRQMRLVYPFEK